MAGQDAIFAPTPPLESLRMVLSYAATDIANHVTHVWDPASEKRTQILLIDISRAYFNAKTDDSDPVYVDFPPELGAPPGTCGLLRRHSTGQGEPPKDGKTSTAARWWRWDSRKDPRLPAVSATRPVVSLWQFTATTSPRQGPRTSSIGSMRR